jgi:hypothetical protein
MKGMRKKRQGNGWKDDRRNERRKVRKKDGKRKKEEVAGTREDGEEEEWEQSEGRINFFFKFRYEKIRFCRDQGAARKGNTKLNPGHPGRCTFPENLPRFRNCL